MFRKLLGNIFSLMADETNVNAGSDNSGDTADTTATEQSDTAAQTTDTTATDTAQADQGAADAGDAAEQEGNNSAAPAPGASCICKDGRPGTVHDLGGEIVCLPNQG